MALKGPKTGSYTNFVNSKYNFNRLPVTDLGGFITTDPYFNYTTLLLPGTTTNGAQNNTFLDSSNNTFSITRNGNPTQGTFSPFSQTGWSGYFTGAATSYLTTAGTNFINQGQNYTVQCWIYPTSFTTSTSAVRRMYIFIKGVIYAGLSIHSDGTLGWYGWPTPGGMIVTSAAGTITTNSWQHVALVVSPSGNYIKLFKNGEEVGTAAYTAAGAGGAAIQIGHGDTGQGTDGFIGYISNFKISPSALTSGQLDYSATPSISSPTGSGLLTLQTNRFNDTSANAFVITNGGASSVQAFSPFAPTAEYSVATVGGSGFFDGTGDYLSFASNSAFNVGSGDYTFEAWVYQTARNATAGTVFTLRNADDTAFPDVCIESGGALRGYMSGGAQGSASTLTVPLNTWTHIAWVRNSATVYYYINGAAAGSTAQSTNWSTAQTPKIGGQGWNSAFLFIGYISNARFTKSAVYTGNFTPPSLPITAAGSSSPYTSTSNVNVTFSAANTGLLTNFTNAGIIDITAKNVLETAGNAQNSTTQSKFGGSSIYFDGTGDYLFTPSSVINNLSGDFTFEAWVYRVGSGSDHSIIDIGDYYGSTGIVFYVAASGALAIYSGSGLMSGGTISANTWTHVALVRSGSSSGNLKLYVNGSSVGTPATSTSTFTGAMYVGTGLYNGGLYNSWNGYLDDVRITKYARYTGNFTPPTSTFRPL